jgi:succinyl-CoA synthetase alpha subunit
VIVEANDCGVGAEIGIISRSSDGLSNLSVNIRSDRVGDTTRTGLGLKFERTF